MFFVNFNYIGLFLGIPDAVPNLSINFNISCLMNGTIEIDWDPVFSLMTTRDSDDLKYMVEVNDLHSSIVNTTTSDNFVLAVLPNYIPINASCVSFNITVTSSNSAGRGNTSSDIISALQTGI